MSLHSSLLSASPVSARPPAWMDECAGNANVGVIDDIYLTWSHGTTSNASRDGLTLASGAEPGISDVNGWHPRIADY
jgi:hypothetical protein